MKEHWLIVGLFQNFPSNKISCELEMIKNRW